MPPSAPAPRVGCVIKLHDSDEKPRTSTAAMMARKIATATTAATPVVIVSARLMNRRFMPR